MGDFKLWLEDLHTLRHNTETGFNTQRRHNIVDTVSDPTMAIVPRPESRQLLVKATVPGSQGKVYEPQILFNDVDFRMLPADDQMTIDTFLLRNPKNGRLYYLGKLSTRGQHVQVVCTCPDFIYTFADPNQKQGAYLGTDQAPTPRNLNTLPGVCKHLLRLINKLGDKGVLVDGRI